MRNKILFPIPSFIHFFQNLKKKDKKFFITLLIIFVISCLVIFDRVLWASISQWREDQAVNLWIGYVQPIRQMPVGLISSQAIPNPNGMMLMGIIISKLPGLWVISSTLGGIQALLLSWLCWAWFRKSQLFLVTLTITLSSAILRAISVEFWNQWVLLYFDIFFFIFLSSFITRPRVTLLPILVLLIMVAPSLYLGGLSNSAGFLLLFMIVFLKTRPLLDTHYLGRSIFSSIFIIGLLLGITWVPYFRAINWADFSIYSQSTGGIARQVGIALLTMAGFIGWNFTWILRLFPNVMFFEGNALPYSANYFVYLNNFILEYMTFISFITLGFAALSSYKKNKNFSEIFIPDYHNQGKLVLFAYSFFLINFALVPLLKGPFLINGERIDMTFQYFPFFLIFCFVTPFVVQLPTGFQQLVARVTTILAVTFAVTNLLFGWMTIISLQKYSGGELLRADVPLTQKLAVVKFIAEDWYSKSNSKDVPIFYDFEAVIPELQKDNYGNEITPWYAAPYTLGRAMDYELLRNYQLHNSQEGVPQNERRKDHAIYIVHYSFLPLQLPSSCFIDHPINRLSVAILTTNLSECKSK